MTTLIQPAIAVMNRLKYPQKFILISILFALPLAVVMTVLIAQFDERINFARKELDGAAYLRPLRRLIEDVPQQRALAHLYLSGDTNLKTAVMSRQAQIDVGFKAVEAIDQRLGESVPLDAVFRDESGRAVRLGDYFASGKPVETSRSANRGKYCVLQSMVTNRSPSGSDSRPQQE